MPATIRRPLRQRPLVCLCISSGRWQSSGGYAQTYKGLGPRRPGALSGGQQQRVALARDPNVLLLDEPFSAVDQVTRRKLHRELARLRTRLDAPIVLVTHNLDEAAALSDRLCILYKGKTLQDGPPREVLPPCL